MISHYDIKNFSWNNRDKTFYANAWDLFDMDIQENEKGWSNYFLSEKNPFAIVNKETGNERVFDFVQEEWYDDPVIGQYKEMRFETKDGELQCVIMDK